MLVTLSGYICHTSLCPRYQGVLEGRKQSVILVNLGYLSSELKKDLEQ